MQRKYLTLSALAASMLLSLTACGGGGGGSDSTAPAPTEIANVSTSGAPQQTQEITTASQPQTDPQQAQMVTPGVDMQRSDQQVPVLAPKASGSTAEPYRVPQVAQGANQVPTPMPQADKQQTPMAIPGADMLRNDQKEPVLTPKATGSTAQPYPVPQVAHVVDRIPQPVPQGDQQETPTLRTTADLIREAAAQYPMAAEQIERLAKSAEVLEADKLKLVAGDRAAALKLLQGLCRYEAERSFTYWAMLYVNPSDAERNDRLRQRVDEKADCATAGDTLSDDEVALAATAPLRTPLPTRVDMNRVPVPANAK